MTATADEVIARGRKVALRKKRSSDASNDYAWRCDPELARFDGVPPLRISYQDFYSGFSQEISYTSPYRCTYAIEDDAGRHIGNIMYYNADKARSEVELGISIGERACWSRGYGTDAVVTLLSYLFQQLDFQRVYLHTLEWNVRAQRCFEKAGFADCGTSWRNGHKFIVMEVRREATPEGVPEPSP